MSAALLKFKPTPNPLSTKFKTKHYCNGELALLLLALAEVVDELKTNIDIRIKAGAE